ncbi:MAG: glucosidase [Candidatus Eisenbacteria bacterium]|uniref:Glucosidase n=1 Tax=Eiseniibacteriota bacterium TaxID=2212470 RepID=A0A538STY2_UNCEI|nr:MAG: glucosidase [Candidatus Eisenbacteria bacterium]
MIPGAEQIRLAEDAHRERNWKRWGPYLAERQWGTVREDYSADGTSWDHFPHDHARSRAYRWGEDGLFGICDRECRLCFAIALWNERDPILKERFFGLSASEGNHGEDVKECYYYLDATPTHSYLKALYRYPQGEFPYARLVEENRRRGRLEREFELEDAGVFEDGRYFDLMVEYAKAAPDDILIRITAENRGPEAAALHLLPTLWFRNTWVWGRSGEGYGPRPRISRGAESTVLAEHATLGAFRLAAGLAPFGRPPALLFTENETNARDLYGDPNGQPFAKDAFHDYVVRGRSGAVNPARAGTKAAAYYRVELPARERFTVRLRLTAAEEAVAVPLGREFDAVFEARIREADEFYQSRLPGKATEEECRVARQAYAGLMWSKQFYHYVVKDWLEGDPAQPPPPASRPAGRNHDWTHLYNRDVISMPDKWEYPWYAAWDLAFHMIPFARLDPEFAKQQLLLFLREWYMHPNGQIPAYEWALGDVNPPVHAWACWRVYKMTGPRGKRDRRFLERAFHKLLLNFTWWVNRKDLEGNHLFAGGFLGLDNIGVFDRSQPLPTGGHLEQADGTAWMAFYCATMLSMALELASEDAAYEDVASKFFEHFVAIVDAMNAMGGGGLWDEADGFYYDQLHIDGMHTPLRVRSMVGIIPLFAVENLDESVIARLRGFSKRMAWFLENRPELGKHVLISASPGEPEREHRLLAIASRDRLERVLARVLDENEFLSPWGVRSLSRVHREHPFVLQAGGAEYRVGYQPEESDTVLFGGNSNWRGPVWFPLNFLLIEALERHHHFYGEGLQVECPTGSGRRLSLREVAHELSGRLARLFLPDERGRRPCHGGDARYAEDPAWRDLVLFHEYFSAESGRGLGAAHQTGWTALVTQLIEDVARRRASDPAPEGTPAVASGAGESDDD